MGWYERLIPPSLLHTSMRQTQLRPLRSRLIGAAEGRVLEIGVGSGLNLAFYGRHVTQLIGIDPSSALLAKAKPTARWSRCPIRLLKGRCEKLPLASASVDHVVMTWTLCSLADPIGTLGEVRRVLKPGGAFLFIEHGLAPDRDLWIQHCQNRLTPLWRRMSGNCHLNRRIDQLLIAAGLWPTQLEQGYLVRGPKLATYHYQGRAVIA